jgi:hypothetical protein
LRHDSDRRRPFLDELFYFGRSVAAHDLLKSWNNLAREFSTLPSGYLLDAAWALASSQRHLVSVWIPMSVDDLDIWQN